MLHHYITGRYALIVSDVNRDLYSAMPPIEYFFSFDYWKRVPKDGLMKPSSIEDSRPLRPTPLRTCHLASNLIRWMAKALIGGQK